MGFSNAVKLKESTYLFLCYIAEVFDCFICSETNCSDVFLVVGGLFSFVTFLRYPAKNINSVYFVQHFIDMFFYRSPAWFVGLFFLNYFIGYPRSHTTKHISLVSKDTPSPTI